MCALLPKVRSMRSGRPHFFQRTCFSTWNFVILGATAAVVSHYLLVIVGKHAALAVIIAGVSRHCQTQILVHVNAEDL